MDRLSEKERNPFDDTVDQIKKDHLEAARKVIKGSQVLREVEEELEYDCERLRGFLNATQVCSYYSLSQTMGAEMLTSFRMTSDY